MHQVLSIMTTMLMIKIVHIKSILYLIDYCLSMSDKPNHGNKCTVGKDRMIFLIPQKETKVVIILQT